MSDQLTTAQQTKIDNLGQPLFMRKWRILIHTKPNEPTAALDLSNLKCVFSVNRTATSPICTVDLDIYNLNPVTEGEIIQSGYALIIEAGYQNGPYGKICDADILQVIRTRENGTDYKLTIVALEGDKELFSGFVKSSIAANSTPRQIIELVAKNSSKPIEIGTISDNLKQNRLPRGKVLFGRPNDILNNVVDGNDAVMYMNADRQLNITKPTDPIPEGMTVVLTPTTGLIGVPEYTDQGIRILSLLNPRIVPNTMVKIDNELIRLQKIQINIPDPQKGATNNVMPQWTQFDQDGEYQAFSVHHMGDTWGNDWKTTVVGIGRNGRNGLLANINSDKQNPKG